MVAVIVAIMGVAVVAFCGYGFGCGYGCRHGCGRERGFRSPLALWLKKMLLVLYVWEGRLFGLVRASFGPSYAS